jgi:lantibiotic biosynthesis protein
VIVSISNAVSPRYLEASVRIGDRIVRDAFWHMGRCNWVGAQPRESEHAGRPANSIYRALGPELYSGTSGVSLFLAELYRVTGDAAVRNAALGALRHALSQVDSIPPSVRIGLFSGWTGIALVAARVAILLDDPSLFDCAKDLAKRAAAQPCDKNEFDMISGRAGAIVALLVLRALLDEPDLLEAAARFGCELIESAARDGETYSWELPGIRSYRNLTGFSHGTAGAAVALLELYAETEETLFRDAALGAFQYERRYFSADHGNWPDFRRNDSNGRHRPSRFPCISFWCHGAPGIALSRLRACQLLGEESFKAEAAIALATTRDSIAAAHASSSGNYSLCHGLAGNSEAILYGAHVLDDRTADPTIVFETALTAIGRYAVSGASWPCGTHIGETPGLMLGLSGIGHHLLRLNHPSIPSVTLLNKRHWTSGTA